MKLGLALEVQQKQLWIKIWFEFPCLRRALQSASCSGNLVSPELLGPQPPYCTLPSSLLVSRCLFLGVAFLFPSLSQSSPSHSKSFFWQGSCSLPIHGCGFPAQHLMEGWNSNYSAGPLAFASSPGACHCCLVPGTLAFKSSIVASTRPGVLNLLYTATL